MEITLSVTPHGSVTFHCTEPFIHRLISLDELEATLQELIETQKRCEAAEIEKERLEDSLSF